MTIDAAVKVEQERSWNDVAGPLWVASQVRFRRADAQVAELGELLEPRAGRVVGERPRRSCSMVSTASRRPGACGVPTGLRRHAPPALHRSGEDAVGGTAVTSGAWSRRTCR